MNKQQLANKIWESANKMRSKIEANEYKDYILGFIFYKYLSDQEIAFLRQNGVSDEEMPDITEEDKDTVEFIQNGIGFFIAYLGFKNCGIGSFENGIALGNLTDPAVQGL